MNKYAILDGNNLAQIAFHRGKSIVHKDKYKEYAEQNSISEADAKKKVVLDENDYASIEGMAYLVFFRKLHKLYKNFKDHIFIMTWDSPGSSDWRREVYEGYKANRNYTADPIWSVFFTICNEIRGILDAYPIYQIKIERLEADDIMYEMSKKLSAERHKVVIISGDSDMIQVVQEFGVKLFNPIKHKYVPAPKTYDYCTYKAIKGDKSDTIEGLVGYGEKNSVRLAEEVYNEDFLDAFSAPELSKEQYEKVLKNLKVIRISNNPNLKEVVVDIPSIDKDNYIDLARIKKFYFDKKIKTLLEGFDGVAAIFS